MKLLYCLSCGDIRAADPDGAWTSCRCQNMRVRWLNPAIGKLEVDANNREDARVIGLNNRFLDGGQRSDEGWRALHDDTTTHARGYIFHVTFRDCWACVLVVGETGDVTWYDRDAEAVKA